MGRATWESLPAAVRPLPGRHNVVLTRRPGWQAPGAEVCGSLAAALDRAGDVWVVGGASVYAEALPHADLVVVTELADAVEGDTFAPDLGSALAGPGLRPGGRLGDLADRSPVPGGEPRPGGVVRSHQMVAACNTRAARTDVLVEPRRCPNPRAGGGGVSL